MLDYAAEGFTMPGSDETRIIRFGVFEVDLQTGELRRNGFQIRLQEQPFQVLATLLQRHGELVTRDELRRALWPADTFVDFDHSLNAAIKRLRDALGESAETPRFVQTVARRGYRFIAPVEPSSIAGKATIPTDTKRLLEQTAKSGGELRSRHALTLVLGGALVAALGVGALWILKHRESSGQELIVRRLTSNSSDNPVTGALLSPDGKYIAFRDQTGMHLKLIETGEIQTIPKGVNSESARLADGTQWFPGAWFPDSTRLLANVIQPGPERSPSIWAISLFGAAPHELREGASAESMSPNGSMVAFTVGDGYVPNREIWVMGPHGEDARKVLAAADGYGLGSVVWSPDSRSMAYISSRHGPDFNFTDCALRIRRLDTGDERMVLSEQRLCGGSRTLWWPAANRIFASLGQPAASRQSNLYEIMMDFSRGGSELKPRTVTSWPASNLQFLSGTSDGKRLSILRVFRQDDVYTAQLEADGKRLTNFRRLTLDESNDGPTAWTPDNNAVLFMSERNGPANIFKQKINEADAEPVVTGPDDELIPRVSPDGKWILYVSTKKWPRMGASEPVRIMRVPVSGGPSQFVLEARDYFNHSCTQAPLQFCLLGEQNMQRTLLLLTTFDPLRGRGAELARFELDARFRYGWAISPSGLAFALFKTDAHQSSLRYFAVSGGATPVLRKESAEEVKLDGWGDLASIDWSADSKSLFVASISPRGAVLLHVRRDGRATVLREWNGSYGVVWGVPSGDGRYLALRSPTVDSNVWLIENF
jgi:DNA-binding winged helix-turn-helix (wHTH) protein/Tol biopolymer transport system component